jgi:hypothetical protein
MLRERWWRDALARGRTAFAQLLSRTHRGTFVRDLRRHSQDRNYAVRLIRPRASKRT